MQVPEAFGPAERLHAAIRERDPQLAVSIVRDDETGLPHVYVTRGYAGPWTVRWKSESYQMRILETDPWTDLSDDLEKTADAIVDGLRAVHKGSRP